MRILIGFYEVAGYFSKLRDSLRAVGQTCDLLTVADDWRSYSASETPTRILSFVRWIENRQITGRGLLFKRTLWTSLQLVARLCLFAWALPRYDVFVFSACSTFLSDSKIARHWDLPILRLLGKKIVVVFLGSEARPGYMSRVFEQRMRQRPYTDWVMEVRAQKQRIRAMERYASYMVCHPPYAQFLERPFINFLSLGIPVPQVQIDDDVRLPRDYDGRLRIVHAPSNPELKGTSRIREVISELVADGYDINYVELVGRPNTEVLRELRQCDLVIDQLYSDTPLALFSVEAGSFGKPAVVGGYYSDEIADDIPAGACPPSVYVHPDDIKNGVKRLLDSPEDRATLGKSVAAFLDQNWSGKKVAERYLRLIAGNAPDEWWYDPVRVRYVLGVGLAAEDVKQIVRGLAAYGSMAAFSVDDKPALLERLMALRES